jgi:hypothetical protein
MRRWWVVLLAFLTGCAAVDWKMFWVNVLTGVK